MNPDRDALVTFVKDFAAKAIPALHPARPEEVIGTPLRQSSSVKIQRRMENAFKELSKFTKHDVAGAQKCMIFQSSGRPEQHSLVIASTLKSNRTISYWIAHPYSAVLLAHLMERYRQAFDKNLTDEWLATQQQTLLHRFCTDWVLVNPTNPLYIRRLIMLLMSKGFSCSAYC